MELAFYFMLLNLPWIVEMAYNYIKEGKKPNKFVGWVIRVGVSGAMVLVVASAISPIVPVEYSRNLQYILLLFTAFFLHAGCFNVSLNLMRDREWSYLGGGFIDDVMKRAFPEKSLLAGWYLIMLFFAALMYFGNQAYYGFI